MKFIIVTSKADAARAYKEYSITHVLTILNSGEGLSCPVLMDRNNWKRINCSDAMKPDHLDAPTKEMVIEALTWANNLPDDARLLVHCWAGISRSTAMAIAIMVQKYGYNSIDHCVNHVYSMRKVCCPNPVITKYADEYLDCNGELHKKAQERVKFLLLNDVETD